MDGKKGKKGMASNIFESMQAMLPMYETEQKKEKRPHENVVNSRKMESLLWKSKLKFNLRNFLKVNLCSEGTKETGDGLARETDKVSCTNDSEKEVGVSVTDSTSSCENERILTSSAKLLNTTVTEEICHGNSSENFLKKIEVPNVNHVAINADQIYSSEENLKKSAGCALYEKRTCMDEFKKNTKDQEVTIASIKESDRVTFSTVTQSEIESNTIPQSEIESNTVSEDEIPGSDKKDFRVKLPIRSEEERGKLGLSDSNVIPSKSPIITGNKPEEESTIEDILPSEKLKSNENEPMNKMSDMRSVCNDEDTLSNCSEISHYSEGVDVVGEFEFEDCDEMHSGFENTFYDEDDMSTEGISKEGYKSHENITRKQIDVINSDENEIYSEESSLGSLSIDLQGFESSKDSKVSSDGIMISSSKVPCSDFPLTFEKQKHLKSLSTAEQVSASGSDLSISPGNLEGQSENEIDSTTLVLNSDSASLTTMRKENSSEILSKNPSTDTSLSLKRKQKNVDMSSENIRKMKEDLSKIKPVNLSENHQNVTDDSSENLSPAVSRRNCLKPVSKGFRKVVKISIHSPKDKINKKSLNTEIPVPVVTGTLQTANLSSSSLSKPISYAKKTDEMKESKKCVIDLLNKSQLSNVEENKGRMSPKVTDDLSSDTILAFTVDMKNDQSTGTATSAFQNSQKDDQTSKTFTLPLFQEDSSGMTSFSIASDVLNMNKELESGQKMNTSAQVLNSPKDVSVLNMQSLSTLCKNKLSNEEIEKNEERGAINELRLSNYSSSLLEEQAKDFSQTDSALCRSEKNQDVEYSSTDACILSKDKSPSEFQQKIISHEKESSICRETSYSDNQNLFCTKLDNSPMTISRPYEQSSQLTVVKDSMPVKLNIPNLNLIRMKGDLLPKIPCVNTKKENSKFDGEFFVGKLNGAFICLKCRSKFYETKTFRWHLWHHIHLNSLRCSYCTSTDPTLPCKTTDSVLGFVLKLENKKIFSIKPKRGATNDFITMIRGPNGIEACKNLYSHRNRGPNSDVSGTKYHPHNGEIEVKHETDDFMEIKIVNTFSMSTGEVFTHNSAGEKKMTDIENFPGGFFRCSACNFSFLFVEKLESHLQKFHNPVNSFKCQYCGQILTGIKQFCLHYFEHINSCLGFSNFKCPYPDCLGKMNKLEEHLTHMSSHKNWKPICCKCDRVFETIQQLSDHYRQNLLSFFSCSYCRAKTVEKRAILEHLCKCHQNQGRMMVVAKMLACGNFKADTKGNSELKCVEDTHEKIGTFEETQEVLETKKPVSNQVASSPISNEKKLSADKSSSELSFSTFLCQKCSFVCNDKQIFLCHKKVHLSSKDPNEKPLSCPLCPALFDLLQDLSLHLNYHDTDTEFSIYQCPRDDYFTNDKQKGKLHISQSDHMDTELIVKRTVHHKNKIFHCSFCRIKVQEFSIYKKHLSIHGVEGEQEAKKLRDLNLNNSIKHIHSDESISKTHLSPEVSSVNDCLSLLPEIAGNSLQEEHRVSRNENNATVSKEASSTTPHRRKSSSEIIFEHSDPYVTDPYNLVIEANDTYKNSVSGIDVKLEKLYSEHKDHFICVFCDASFHVKNLLINHLVEHLDIPYCCSFCHIQCKTYDEAAHHVLRYHKIEKINVIYSVKLTEKVNGLLLKRQPSDNFLSPRRKKNVRKIFTSINAPSKRTKLINQLMEAKPKKNVSILKGSMVANYNIGDNPEFEAFLMEQDTKKALDFLITTGLESSWCKVCGKIFSQRPSEILKLSHHLLTEHIKYQPQKCSLCSFWTYFEKIIFHHYKIKHPGQKPGKTQHIMSAVITFIQKSGLDIPLHNMIHEIVTEDYQYGTSTISFDFPFNVLENKTKRSIKNTEGKSIQSRSEEIREVVKLVEQEKRPLNTIACKSSSKNNDNGSISLKSNIDHIQLVKCPKCDFVTEKKHRPMLNHFKKHSLECFVQCFYCSVRYTEKQLLEKHCNLIHKGLPVKYNRLSVDEYFQPIDLPKSLQQNVEKKLKDDSPQKGNPKNMICLFCNMEEVNEDYMRYHLNLHLGYKPFECGICSLSYCDPFQQKQHIYMDHNSPLDKSPVNRLDSYEEIIDKLLADCKKILQEGNENISWNLGDIKRQLSKKGENPLCNSTLKQINPSSIKMKERKKATGIDIPEITKMPLNKNAQPSQPIPMEREEFPGDKKDSSKTAEKVSKNHLIEVTSSNGCTYNNKTYSSNKRKQVSPFPMDRKLAVKKMKISAVASETTLHQEGKEMVNGKHTCDLLGINNVEKIPETSVNTSDCSRDVDMSVEDKFNQENILCYFCDYSSQALTEVMSHTQQEHVGRNIVALLWIDKRTGGTFDHEGHMFLNGFDSDINIEKPYLCTICSYRAENYEDAVDHVEEEHDSAKSSNVIKLQKSVPSKGNRGRTPSTLKKPISIKANEGLKANSELVSKGFTYSCNLCAEISSSEHTFRCHLAQHESYSKCLKPDLSSNPSLKCQRCSFKACNANQFIDHIMTDKTVVQFKCYYCPFKANSTKAVKVHQHRRHPERQRKVLESKLKAPSCFSSCNPGLVQKYMCGICDFKADSTRAVKLHYRGKHPDKERKINKIFEENPGTDVGNIMLVNLEPKVVLEDLQTVNQNKLS